MWLNLNTSCSNYMQCMDDVHLQLSISNNIAVFGSVYVLIAHSFPQRLTSKKDLCMSKPGTDL